jgi:hypothetical protein
MGRFRARILLFDQHLRAAGYWLPVADYWLMFSLCAGRGKLYAKRRVDFAEFFQWVAGKVNLVGLMA